MTTNDTQRLIDAEVEQSELTRHMEPPAEAPTRPGREAARVYSVRLAPDTVDELERVAKDLDVPTSALIRGFIADGLATRKTRTVADVVDKLNADVHTLRMLIGGRGADIS